MKRFLTLLSMMTLLCGTVAAADFHPITAVSSSTAATDLWPASNLIQGPGTGFNAAPPHEKLLFDDAGNWVTDACGFPCDYIATNTPTLTFDLGAGRLLSEISVWGYTTSNANGAKEISLKFGTDAEGAAGVGSSITYNPTFAVDLEDIARQSKPFSQSITARYVALTATDNYFVAPGDGSTGGLAGGDRVGLGEVAFAVPEPSGLTLLAIGMLAAWRRRR